MTRIKTRLFAMVMACCLYLTQPVGFANGAEFKLGYFESTSSVTLLGRIVEGDFKRFKSLIKKVADQGDVVTHLYLFSPGGSVDEALKIGRLASKLALTTVAPFFNKSNPQKLLCSYRDSKTYQDYRDHSYTYHLGNGAGNPSCNCASSCFLIWTAGARRKGNYLGIHRTFFRPESFKKDTYQVARNRYVRLRRTVENYLEEMNVPNLVTDTMFSVASNRIEPLRNDLVKVLQGAPALDEYLRAHCPEETKLREQQQAALDAAKRKNSKQAKRAAAQKKFEAAYLRAYRCEIKVRRKIFRSAWEAEVN